MSPYTLQLNFMTGRFIISNNKSDYFQSMLEKIIHFKS